MPTLQKQKKPAPVPPAEQAKPEYIEAQIMGREINPEYLSLRVPDADGNWRKARLRIPRRLSHCFKIHSTVRVAATADPMMFEPFPSIL